MTTSSCALTLQRLFELVSYDPGTGRFRWHARRAKCHPGSTAGSKDRQGYIRLRLDNVQYKAHALAWLYVYGSWPTSPLRHLDGDKSNNAISNLAYAQGPTPTMPALGLEAVARMREAEARAKRELARAREAEAEKNRQLQARVKFYADFYGK